MGALAQNKGAKAVLATLWSISDASTPELMQEFYTGKESRHLTTVEALRLAQLGLLKGTMKPQTIRSEDPPKARGARRASSLESGKTPFVSDPTTPYSHPYFWAPFILIGVSVRPVPSVKSIGVS